MSRFFIEFLSFILCCYKFNSRLYFFPNDYIIFTDNPQIREKWLLDVDQDDFDFR